METNAKKVVRGPSLLSVGFDDEHDGTNFRKSVQIDMKGLVGDAVGNMSISPWSRDVVLAARRGLFIIDLEAPFEVPRFLPQGGTWDVADVQWNPHPSRAEYIVSTSSEKLLIWNLYMTGKTSIEHILHAHYRAITDINWHTAERDIVASTGIDSWVWTWDMRQPRKPVLGLCAFSSPGTHVKWNRQNSHILASSHADKVLIWDRRKGSLPVNTIDAHTSRIYGIDWSHTEPTEIVTCSLDKSIKVWNSKEATLKTTIKTGYPIWRARSLPFGHGVLSLAQRGETALEMFSLDSQGVGSGLVEYPVDSFQGHSDVVKEFVWRKNIDDSAFQLITWSKDRTLRFWPVEYDMMQKVGYSRDHDTQESTSAATSPHSTVSFRDPLTFPDSKLNTETTLDANPNPNPISAPIGHRSILAEVRAGGPYSAQTQTRNRPRTNSSLLNPYHQLYRGPNDWVSSDSASNPAIATAGVGISVAGPPGGGGGGTMSRGAAGGLKSRARVDALSWLSSVKDATGTVTPSSSTDLIAATSVGDIGVAGDQTEVKLKSASRDKSGSKDSKFMDDNEKEIAQPVGPSLQDEVTSVLSKLPSSKVRLEKHDLSLAGNRRHRTVTLGLQVPWARSESGSRRIGSGLGSGATYSYSTQSVFLRVTFTFPREYPQNSDTHDNVPFGHLPTVSMEETPLITNKDRAFMLKRLRRIIATLRERQKLCLEACIRFLVFKDETFVDMDEDAGDPRGVGSKRPGLGGAPRQGNDLQDDSDSSEDETMGDGSHGRDNDVTTLLLRNNKNLAEPRTCQGSFGPNGELVCFFRAPPRIVRNAVSALLSQTRSPARSSLERDNEGSSIADHNVDGEAGEDNIISSSPRIFHQSPALLSDAVHRLSIAATDRDSTFSLAVPPSASTIVADSRLTKGSTYAVLDSRTHFFPTQTTQSQITRIMTNLLTFPQHRGRRHSNSFRSSAELPGGYEGGEEHGVRGETTMVGGSRRSEVSIANTTALVGGDKCVAEDYIFPEAPVRSSSKSSFDHEAEGSRGDLVEVCNWNASVAKIHGRYDHERIFRSLGAVLGIAVSAKTLGENRVEKEFDIGSASRWLRLVKQLLDRLFANLRAQKDAQMLAMLAVIALQLFPTPNSVNASSVQSLSTRPSSALDYFSSAHGHASKTTPAFSSHQSSRSPLSAPGSVRMPSAPATLVPASSLTPRGSWSNIFSSGRQFIAGALPAHDNQDTTVMPISPAQSPSLPSPSWITVPQNHNAQHRLGSKALHVRLPGSPNRLNRSRGSASPPVPAPPSGVSKSWNESLPQPKETSSSFSSTGHTRKRTFSQVVSAAHSNGKRRTMVFEAASTFQIKEDLDQPIFLPEEVALLLQHLHFYSEMLARWELYHKRGELLKLFTRKDTQYDHDIGLMRTCTNCTAPLLGGNLGPICGSCGYLRTTPRCTFCRLAVKGLSVNCLRCFHVTHISCWKKLHTPICPSGCGCACQISVPGAEGLSVVT